MECSLSGFYVTTQDSVLFENGKRISIFLVEWWLEFSRVPGCPLTGSWWTNQDVAQILSKTTTTQKTCEILNAHQPNPSPRAFS